MKKDVKQVTDMLYEKHKKKKVETKTLKLQFNNKWDELDSTDSFDLIVPIEVTKKMIKEEFNSFKRCDTMLSDGFDIDNYPSDEDFKEYNVSKEDFDIAKIVLDYGDCGIIGSRFLDFLVEKHSDWSYNQLTTHFDLEFDIF